VYGLQVFQAEALQAVFAIEFAETCEIFLVRRVHFIASICRNEYHAVAIRHTTSHSLRAQPS